jgi:hypothetical protein
MRRFVRPTLTALEPRDNPSGTVTASVAGHTLTLTGDLRDNSVAVHRDAAGHVVVTGENDGNLKPTTMAFTGTAGSVNNTNPNNQFTSVTGITGITFSFKDGNETIVQDAGTAPFAFSTGFKFNAGGGNNTLTLQASGAVDAIALGGLSVVGAGPESITVGSVDVASALGRVSFGFGPDGGNATINNATTNGVTATGGVGAVNVGLITVTGPTPVPPAVTVSASSATLDLNVTNSQLGSVSEKTASEARLELDQSDPGSMSTGAVTVAGGPQGSAEVVTGGGTVTTTGLTITGGKIILLLSATSTKSGTVNIKSSLETTSDGSDITLSATGPVTISGGGFVEFQGGTTSIDTPGTLTVSAQIIQVDTDLTVGGSVSVTGSHIVGLDLGDSHVGSLSVTGGGGASTFFENFVRTGSGFQTTAKAGNVSLTLGAGGVPFTLGGTVNGNLTVKSMAAATQIDFAGAHITGNTTINTGVGTNTVTFEDNSKLDGTTFVSQGGGDDTINLGATLTFGGKLTVLQGDGNDTVTGTVTGSTFAPGSIFDGGKGYNTAGAANLASVNPKFVNYQA